MSNQQFLDNIILPYFKGFLKQNVDTALYDHTGRVLAVSEASAHLYGVSLTDLIGFTYRSCPVDVIKKTFSTNNAAEVRIIQTMFEKIATIMDCVVTEKRILNFVDVLPYKKVYHAIFVHNIPLFDHDGNVVAIQVIGTKFHLYGINNYLNALNNPKILARKSQPLTIKLTSRQHEILYLLLIGMSQTEVAFTLGIKRGTVSAIISNSLCPKFNIHGTNTTLLLNKARKMHIHDGMPASLYKPRVILFDESEDF